MKKLTLKQERDHWKQRALAAEAQLGINLPFATEKLTAKQQRVFELIEQYFLKHHVVPTIRQIAEMADLYSSSTAFRYVEALEKKGYIERRGKQGFRLLVRSEVK